ncbi:MAG: imidazole glycerol phosphate synthase subunit HisH [Bacteroidales bacterium]|nr:imidazole glycerol phosphate synthase subunit HisH [Bacteroidales bacterium]
MITIVNYGMGNVASIANMLKRIGTESLITSEISDIENANKLILPGVGSFDAAVKELKTRKLWSTLNKKVLSEKTPVLGICLGMQLICISSDEGEKNGLGWIDAHCCRFDFGRISELKIPCMGWNFVTAVKKNPLFNGLEEPKFYFVHSYHLKCQNRDDIIATAEYGYSYPAAVQNENIFGVQFHPEKSHNFGMQLLKNFTEI